jgi:aldose 1-epimerase
MTSHPPSTSSVKKNRISYKPWGTHGGKDVFLFKLENASGAFVEITNYGATIVSMVVPDRNGKLENTVIGFPSLEGYANDRCYIGSTIGRFANRIGGAAFTLDGTKYTLEKNDGQNNNHGGPSGFHAKVFDFRVGTDFLSLSLTSADGEGGFPGHVDFLVIYSWSDDHELNIRFNAVSDKKTVLNFTNHAYFNLAPGHGDILEHELTLPSDTMLETDSGYIPTGVIINTTGNNFHQTRIRDRVKFSGPSQTGVNRYFILNHDGKPPMRRASLLTERTSGRTLEIFTTYPGVQLYTGDYLDSKHLSTRFKQIHPFDGLCLECQYYPDAPNHNNFPSTVVEAGQAYDERIVYKFGVRG